MHNSYNRFFSEICSAEHALSDEVMNQLKDQMKMEIKHKFIRSSKVRSDEVWLSQNCFMVVSKLFCDCLEIIL